MTYDPNSSSFVPTFSRRSSPTMAALLQAILGGILVLGGVGHIVMSRAESAEWIEQFKKQGMTLPAPPGWTEAEWLRVALIGAGAMVVGVGLLVLLLAMFVRRGGRASSIASMVINALVGAVFLIDMLLGMLSLETNPATGLFTMLFCGGMAALCGVGLARLLQVARTPRPTAAQGFPMPPPGGGYGPPGIGYGHPPMPPPGAPPVGSPPHGLGN